MNRDYTWVDGPRGIHKRFAEELMLDISLYLWHLYQTIKMPRFIKNWILSDIPAGRCNLCNKFYTWWEGFFGFCSSSHYTMNFGWDRSNQKCDIPLKDLLQQEPIYTSQRIDE